MGMGVCSRNNQKIPGAHKIGWAMSGPGIAGETFYGHEDFSDSELVLISISSKANRRSQFDSSTFVIEFLRGRPRTGDNFTFPSAPDPLPKATKAPFQT